MTSVLMSSIRSSTRRSFICRSSSPRNCLRMSSGSLVRKRTRLPGVRVMTEGGFIVDENVSLFPLHPLSRSHHKMDRAAFELERLAELVVEVAAIREMDRLVDVGEEGERRRRRAQLGAVVEATGAAFDRGRLVLADGAFEDLVE